MTTIICVKCKTRTGSTDIKYLKTENNKSRIKAKCVKCYEYESQFISKDEEKKGNIIFTLPAILGAV